MAERKRYWIELDPPTLTVIARALARENLHRAERGEKPLTMNDYGRRELQRSALAQIDASSLAATG